MKKLLIVDLLVVVLLAGCKEGSAPRGSGEVKEVSGARGSGEIVAAPALPPLVELGAEPYYQHAGYFYFYQDSRWSFSQSRNGPWVGLPGDRYPREVKFIVAPPLPPIVVLSAEPYYQHAGYFYFFQGNRWSFSQSRSGPWVQLPGDRYPKEVKFNNQGAQPSGPRRVPAEPGRPARTRVKSRTRARSADTTSEIRTVSNPSFSRSAMRSR